MTDQKWALKGIYFECCRANGQCPLTFGRDKVDGPCTNLATYKVTEGQIQGVDMKGVIYTTHADGIGPKITDFAPGKKGIAEIAIYIDDNATSEQKKILEVFLSTHLSAARSQKILGVKFVKIEIKEENGKYSIANPYCEQNLTLTVGGDQKTPVILENPRNPRHRNVKVCNSQWSYTDYGKKLEFYQASGQIADFFYERP